LRSRVRDSSPAPDSKRKLVKLPFLLPGSVESNFDGFAAKMLCDGFVINAGVAQLVERNLAKVEVESSRLFSRSRFGREAYSASFFIAEL
jgi:hypothetical protein